MHARGRRGVFGAAFLSLLLSGLCSAQDKGWQAEWEKIVAEARKEGKVVVTGDPDPVMRREIPAKFTSRFGVGVDFIGGRGGEIVERLKIERQAGAYTMDVFLAGITTMAMSLYPDKMLDPLRPALILPEVVDPSKWKKGKLWFSDPEDSTVLRLLNYVVAVLYINTSLVKPGEIKSMKDLLHPKWKGKIMTMDPTVSGTGSNDATKFDVLFGEDFVKRLYVDQKPVITRDRRQITDWLARGTYPLTLNAGDVEITRLQQDGFPVGIVYSFSDLPGVVSAGDSLLGLMNRAPHPNAARVFVNWVASREGMEVFSRSRLRATTRNDVDESFLPPEGIPRPGIAYFDSYEWNFTVRERDRVRLRMKELLGR